MDKYKLRRIVASFSLLVVASSCVVAAIGRSSNNKEYDVSLATDDLCETNTETSLTVEPSDSSTALTATELSSSTSKTTTVPNTTYEHTTIHLAEPVPVTTKLHTTNPSTTTKQVEIQKPVVFESTYCEETATTHVSTAVGSITGTTTTTTSVSNTDSKKPAVSLTDSDMKMLAALVTLEAGSEGYECQKAVASVIINRMRTSGSSLRGVIYAKGQFSVAGRVSSTKPFEISTKAVNDVVYNGTTLPIYVTYFRAGRYHTWGDQVAYTRMDHTYFSYSKSLKNKYS